MSSPTTFPSSHHPFVVPDSGRKEDSEVSCHVYRHSGAFIDNQVPPDGTDTPPEAETVPDPGDKASHDCQGQFSYPSYGSTPYNSYLTQSVAHDPLLEPQQCGLDSPPPDASWDVEFFLYGFQGGHPGLYIAEDALPSASSSLAPGVGSHPLSENSDVVSIPEGCRFSGSPTSNSPVENNVPCLRSCEDQQHQEAWVHAFSNLVTPLGTDRYQDDEEAINSYGPQESSRQASYIPRRIPRLSPVPRPYFGARQPSLSSSHSSPVYDSNFYAPSSPSQATPRHQGRSANTKKRAEKKYWCSASDCGRGFTQSQVLGRHIKDVHEAKQPCHFCVSFTWSRGRPHLYEKHLQIRHPQIPPPEVRQNDSSHAKKNSELYVPSMRRPKRANYVPPLKRDASLYKSPYYPYAKQ